MPEQDSHKKIKVTENLYLTKFEIFGLSMIGVALLPLLSKLAVEAFRLAAPAFGLPLSNCSEGDFWLNGLYGIVLSMVVFGLIPSMAPFALGILRLMKKEKYGLSGVLIGTILTGYNLWLGWTTLAWYSDTDNKTIAKASSVKIERAAQDTEAYHAENGSYPASVDQLGGDYGFMGKGHIKLISADNGCFVLQAEHECLSSTVKWESCNGGLQPIKELHEEDPDERIG